MGGGGGVQLIKAYAFKQPRQTVCVGAKMGVKILLFKYNRRDNPNWKVF